jgi:hypothetical protein
MAGHLTLLQLPLWGVPLNVVHYRPKAGEKTREIGDDSTVRIIESID